MGKNTKGYDCVQIPGAIKFTGTKISKAMLPVSRFCGRNVGLATVAVAKSTLAGANKTICCEERNSFYIFTFCSNLFSRFYAQRRSSRFTSGSCPTGTRRR